MIVVPTRSGAAREGDINKAYKKQIQYGNSN